MKRIFFNFDWDVTYLFHKVAIEISKREKDVEFLGSVTGCDYMRFMRKQKDIKYLALQLSQDIAIGHLGKKVDERKLNEFETKYGNPNLWLYIYGDRDLVYYSKRYSHEDIKSIIYSFIEYYENIFKKYKPTALVAWPAADLNRIVMIMVADYFKIPIYVISGSRLSGKIIFLDNIYDKWTKVEKKHNKLLERELKPDESRRAKEFLDKFKESHLRPDAPSSFLKPPKIYFLKGWKIFKYVYQYYLTGELKRDYMRPSPLKRILEEILPFVRWQLLKIFKFFENPKPGEDYLYFPLHVEPELATMVQAPFFVNQISLLWNISKSLPINMKLYVKEHIPMLGKRAMGYYREIKRIPNVRLINAFEDSHELIKNSRIVITITGTAGWEGVLYEKPVINFGKAFYNASGLVENLTDITKLPFLINDMIKKNHRDESDQRKLEKFVLAILENCYPAKLREPLADPETILSDENISLITDALLKEMLMSS